MLHGWLHSAHIYVGLMRATTHPHGAQTLDVGHQLLHGDGRARMHFGAALHGQVATADETDFFVQGFKLQHELRIVHLSQMHGGDVYNNNNNNDDDDDDDDDKNNDKNNRRRTESKKVCIFNRGRCILHRCRL